MKSSEPLTILKTYDVESNTYAYELVTKSIICVSEEFYKGNDEEDLGTLFYELKRNSMEQLNRDKFVIKETQKN